MESRQSASPGTVARAVAAAEERMRVSLSRLEKGPNSEAVAPASTTQTLDAHGSPKTVLLRAFEAAGSSSANSCSSSGGSPAQRVEEACVEEPLADCAVSSSPPRGLDDSPSVPLNTLVRRAEALLALAPDPHCLAAQVVRELEAFDVRAALATQGRILRSERELLAEQLRCGGLALQHTQAMASALREVELPVAVALHLARLGCLDGAAAALRTLRHDQRQRAERELQAQDAKRHALRVTLNALVPGLDDSTGVREERRLDAPAHLAAAAFQSAQQRRVSYDDVAVVDAPPAPARAGAWLLRQAPGVLTGAMAMGAMLLFSALRGSQPRRADARYREEPCADSLECARGAAARPPLSHAQLQAAGFTQVRLSAPGHAIFAAPAESQGHP